VNAEDIERYIQEGRFLTVREAAASLGLSPTSVQLLVEKGVLKAWKTAGGHRRIFPEAVREMLARRGQSPPAAVEPATGDVGARASLAPNPASEEDRPARLDILVAEDDPELQRLYQARLRHFGDGVVLRVARDGVAALLAVGERVPDLMILDIGLPGLNGVEALNSLRADARTAGMPVVVVSGLSRREIADAGPLPSGTIVLGKPIPFDRLFGFIEGLLAVRALREPGGVTAAP
jgi:excisionase family DNA binding protein